MDAARVIDATDATDATRAIDASRAIDATDAIEREREARGDGRARGTTRGGALGTESRDDAGPVREVPGRVPAVRRGVRGGVLETHE
jgi:hypothetical protein|tara:strand:+ start:13192 stop:13452 length:261 start_codon:yes stop_codon:yes gene_type:complete